MHRQTRTLPASLLAALLALALLTAACGDDGSGSASDDSQAPATSETSAVFDPGAVGAGDGTTDDSTGEPGDDPVTPDGPDDPAECVVDPEETNTASIVRDYLECAAPDLAEDVSGAAYDAEVVDVNGSIDPDDAVEICEVVSDFVYSDDLDGPSSTRAVTVSRDSDVLGESAEVLVVRESPDAECEPV